jgi:TPR repeat protein
MCTIKSGLRALVLTALLLPCVFAQTPDSGAAASEKLSGHVAELKKKALSGDTKAQVRLGIAFERGQGVEKNVSEAIHWYHIAADRGNPVAQTNLAYLYENGANGSKDPSEAAKWYLRAAVSGFVRAQFNLGVLYLYGTGVERSEEEAAHWIGQAADAGCPSALTALSYLYKQGMGVPRDPRKALDLIQKSNRQSDPNLCNRLRPESSGTSLSEHRSKNPGANPVAELQ